MKPQRLLRDSYRIIDANLNRAKEGLRVCEDIVRFHLNHKPLTQKFKLIRHNVTAIAKTSGLAQICLFENRDPDFDIVKHSVLNAKKTSFKQIFMANSSRVKEALRVLEEFLKLGNNQSSQKIQKLRFKFYSLEKETITKFPALLDR